MIAFAGTVVDQKRGGISVLITVHGPKRAGCDPLFSEKQLESRL